MSDNSAVEAPAEQVCAHVRAAYMATAPMPVANVPVRCPCCGLRCRGGAGAVPG